MIEPKHNFSSVLVVMTLIVPLVVAFLVLYYPILQGLRLDWRTNPDYSHGYFIPFVCLFMLYYSYRQWRQLKPAPCNTGGVVLLLGLGMLVIGKIGSEFFLQRLSIIVVLAGICLFLLGWTYLRSFAFPLGYLFFMIPLPAIIWNKIAFPLQLFGSSLTENVVRMMGIPVFREGNVLHLVETRLEVVAACSGLRSLMTMFALAALLVFISILPPWKKWVLFFSAAPVAILANIVRLSGTALLASKYGAEVAHGFLHDFSGLVVFALGFSLLLAINRLLAKE